MMSSPLYFVVKLLIFAAAASAFSPRLCTRAEKVVSAASLSSPSVSMWFPRMWLMTATMSVPVRCSQLWSPSVARMRATAAPPMLEM